MANASIEHAALIPLLFLGTVLCLIEGVRSWRSGVIWIDGDDLGPHEATPEPVRGRRARVLAILYGLTAIGCFVTLVRVWTAW